MMMCMIDCVKDKELCNDCVRMDTLHCKQVCGSYKTVCDPAWLTCAVTNGDVVYGMPQ